MTDHRPRPRYGEYAPITSEPHGEQPSPSVSPATAPASAKLPSAELASAEPPQTEAQPAPVATKRRTWDVAVTTALILVGVLDVVGSFAKFGSLAATLRDAYQQQGIGQFTSDALANDMGAVINLTRVALLVAGIGFGLWRLGHNKVAFWVPLTAGALAFMVVFVCLLVIAFTDPALAEYAMRQAATP